MIQLLLIHNEWMYTKWAMYGVWPFVIIWCLFMVARYSGRDFDHVKNWNERFKLWFIYFLVFFCNMFLFYWFMIYHEIWLAHYWGIELTF